MINNSQRIAYDFNDYFSSVVDIIINNIKNGNDERKHDISHSSYLINNSSNSFPNINWKHASTHEISNIIESLKSRNSCGYDGIPVKILKSSAPFFYFPLNLYL